MKKIFLIFLSTFTLLILCNVESKGSCISGYTQDTVTVTIGNCDYKITVCFKCAVTHPGEVCIKGIEEVDSSCINALGIDQIISQAYSEISDGAFIYSNLCYDSWYGAPPCNEENTAYREFNIVFNYCWKVKNRFNGVEYIYDIVPCEENATCTETLKYCFDDPDYVKIEPSTLTSPQTPPCDLEFFEITLPDKDEESDCFILHSVPCGIAQP